VPKQHTWLGITDGIEPALYRGRSKNYATLLEWVNPARAVRGAFSRRSDFDQRARASR
jgi:hypothetical protein